MKGFILILTLFATRGENPSGVAAANFDNLKACEKAGKKWISKLEKRSGLVTGASDRSFYICVESGSVK